MNSFLSGLQTLELVDSLFEQLFSGRKLNTKRYGETPMKPGFLVFEASDDTTLKALVWVHDVVSGVRLGDVVDCIPEDIGRDRDELLRRMRSHYPDIGMDSPIEVVRHLSPLETCRQHGIPDALKDLFTADYIAKIESYA